MIHSSENDPTLDTEITSASLTPSPNIDSLKHASRKVNELLISTKLTKKESTDSGYGDNFDSKALSRIDGFNCVSEFSTDEDSCLSFESILEGKEFKMDLNTSAMSFRREDFGEYKFI